MFTGSEKRKVGLQADRHQKERRKTQKEFKAFIGDDYYCGIYIGDDYYYGIYIGDDYLFSEV